MGSCLSRSNSVEEAPKVSKSPSKPDADGHSSSPSSSSSSGNAGKQATPTINLPGSANSGTGDEFSGGYDAQGDTNPSLSPRPAGEAAAPPKSYTVAPKEVLLPPHMKKMARRERRTSVSAEVLSAEEKNAPYEKIVYPKTEEEVSRIEATISKNFLFNSCLDEQRKEVIDAMFEKKVPAGESIITQGDEGDFFYVVDSGEFDIYVTKYGETNLVVTLGYGASFGELALMYNTPRAATVTAKVDSRCWVIDRVTFRRVLLESTMRKRKLYESFLETIPLLSSLSHWERSTIADALQQRKFADGHVIIQQGEEGESFFLLERGRCVVTKRPADQPDAPEVQVWQYEKSGDYFGELALLYTQPRAATVKADGDVVLATLDKESFERMLGPVEGILKRNKEHYASYEEAIAQAKQNSANNGSSSSKRPMSTDSFNDDEAEEEDGEEDRKQDAAPEVEVVAVDDAE